MRSAVAVASLVATSLAAGARAEPTSTAATTRVAHLRAALDALATLGADRASLDHALYTAIRTTCRARATRASATCMIQVARSLCDRKPDRAACLAASDILLTNQHAERDLLDDVTRMRLVRRGGDYHAAIGAELMARYALLAAEFAITPQRGDPATQLDAFCVGRDRTVHACEAAAPACIPSLAYQRCAAALTWYLASQEASR